MSFLRVCAGCGCHDRPHETSDGTEHWVKSEIRKVATVQAVTPQLQARGWQYKFFQGAHAMHRFSCVECIRKSREADRMVKEHRMLGLAAEQKHDPNYYAMLVQ